MFRDYPWSVEDLLSSSKRKRSYKSQGEASLRGKYRKHLLLTSKWIWTVSECAEGTRRVTGNGFGIPNVSV